MKTKVFQTTNLELYNMDEPINRAHPGYSLVILKPEVDKLRAEKDLEIKILRENVGELFKQKYGAKATERIMDGLDQEIDKAKSELALK